MNIESNIISKLAQLRRVINPPDKIIDLDHLQSLITSPDCYSVVEGPFYNHMLGFFRKLEEVPGDIVSVGVWKGGSALYLQGINVMLNQHRRLWLNDTFNGFVVESLKHPKDLAALDLFKDMLAPHFPTPKGIEQLFRSQGLWTDQIHILEGPVEIELPKAAINEIAFLHIDVDFYEPTYAALENAYSKVSKGGWIVIDDYGVDMFDCRQAVDDFRAKHQITAPLQMLSDYIGYWKKNG